MKILYSFIFLLCTCQIFAQTYILQGSVFDKKRKEAMEFVTVQIEGTSLGSVTDSRGIFTIKNIPSGTYEIIAKTLGYEDKHFKLTINKDIKDLKINLSEQTLALKEVVVTAEKKSSDDASSSYTLNSMALEHLQSTSVLDALSLLPGEQTNKYKSLTSAKHIIDLRGDKLEIGNTSFGTVTEIDGVRLSTNSYYDTNGFDLRNIGNNNIERIEVISGVPSVEYGDMTNGIVKIMTRKGKSPYLLSLSIRPNTQIYSINKGFSLGRNNGVINVSYEYGKSISDIASPYTSYQRNSLMAKYANSIHFINGRNLILEMSLNGNLGCQNSKSDPDAFKNTYSKANDNLIFGSFSLNYNINSLWLSNIKIGADISYTDRLMEIKTNKSSSSVSPSVHTLENGYFMAAKYQQQRNVPIILLQPGYWYETSLSDDKPINYSLYGKMRWYHKFWGINNDLLLGLEFKSSGNKGKGLHYKDLSLAPTWREYRYDQLPFIYNISSYIEDKLKFGSNTSNLTISLGLRQDASFIPKSNYGIVNSISPRLNAKYLFINKDGRIFKNATIRVGWGKAFKLPSFEILYPKPIYNDKLVFTAPTLLDGSTFYAYHTQVSKPIYNNKLRWQYNILRDIGIDIRLKGVRVSLSAFYNTMKSPYSSNRIYTPFDYKRTDQTHLYKIDIPNDKRLYQIDRNTGIVTVLDKTNTDIMRISDYNVIKDFQTSTININGSESNRWGMEFVFDFDKIKAINTSIRIDGKYYHYKGINTILKPATTGLLGKDRQPYKYIGYYIGDKGNFNGYKSNLFNTNITFVTHIPKIKMIFSLRLESTLFNTRQNISWQKGTPRSYPIDTKDDFLPSETKNSIYTESNYIVTYPLYYTSRNNMDTKIPFTEKLLWAYKNDKDLYQELSNLIVKSSTGYIFKEQGYTPYFSANINITKEIGENLTISFFANNFLYTMQKVKNKQTGNYFTLYSSGLVTPFNYGISFKLKI